MGSSSAQLAVASARDDGRGESPAAQIVPAKAIDDELPRRLCSVGIWAGLVAVAVQTTVYLLDTLLAEREPHLLDADGDFSIWAWGSASTVFVGAVASLMLGISVARTRVGAYLGVAAILAFLSLDETVGIHERVTNDLPGFLGVPVYYSRVIWPAVYLPLLATLAVLLFAVSRRLAVRPARLIHVGLVLLALAVVAELSSTVLIAGGQTGRDLPYAVEVAFEEACELGGWILIATALVAAMVSQLLVLGRRSFVAA